MQLNATRLDPLGLTVYEDSQASDPNLQKMRVVFFGDSRAYAWPVPDELDEQFQFINRGIGAQTSVQIVERFDDHIEPLQPDIIILQLCINDLKTIPLFPQLKESIINTCKANITKIVTESRNLGATVILTTIFPLGEIPIERRIVWSDDVAEAIDEVNAFIQSLEGENVIIFDTGVVLADEYGSVKVEYSWDLLHLNEAGYQALNEALVEVLTEIIERSELSVVYHNIECTSFLRNSSRSVESPTIESYHFRQKGLGVVKLNEYTASKFNQAEINKRGGQSLRLRRQRGMKNYSFSLRNDSTNLIFRGDTAIK